MHGVKGLCYMTKVEGSGSTYPTLPYYYAPPLPPPPPPTGHTHNAKGDIEEKGEKKTIKNYDVYIMITGQIMLFFL